jgi:uracil-DNA glycosylase family 4
VFSVYNGNINSKILFIAEAPGRLGADKTTIPLYGDRTGENFDMLLNIIKWTRNDIFITNAVLCNPRNIEGNNDKPTQQEFKNCSAFLEMTINLIRPDLIVTLGISALNSLKVIHDHNYILNGTVGKFLEWNNIVIMPLYHPGPRAVLHRSITKQRGDFIKLANKFDPNQGFKTKRRKISSNQIIENEFYHLILLVLERYKIISYFKLTKLLYLVDLNYIENKGHAFTNAIYLSQEKGPWPPSLKKMIDYMKEKGLIRSRYLSKTMVLQYKENVVPINIQEEDRYEIYLVIDKYKDKDDYEMRSIVYLTGPMKYILAKEKHGESMLNKPVIYNNKTIVDLNRGQF